MPSLATPLLPEEHYYDDGFSSAFQSVHECSSWTESVWELCRQTLWNCGHYTSSSETQGMVLSNQQTD